MRTQPDIAEPQPSALLEARTRLQAGIATLAVSPERIQERLVAAFEQSLGLVREEMLPRNIGARWAPIWQQATSRYSAADGVLGASLRALRDDQAAALAQQLLEVAAAVEQHVSAPQAP